MRVLIEKMTKKGIEWLDFARVLLCFGDCRSPGIGKSVYKGFHLEFPHACFLFHFGHIPFQQIAMGEFLKKNFFRLLLPVVLWHIISMCSWDPIFIM